MTMFLSNRASPPADECGRGSQEGDGSSRPLICARTNLPCSSPGGEGGSCRRKAALDWLCLAILVGLVACFFWKTAFIGEPISKISRLAEWDSLYSAFRTGVGGLCDPSIVQLIIPHYFLVSHIWQSGSLPLWNPYSGFGVPLVGDIQSGVLSPVRLLFNLFPSMAAYNLTLVAEVALAGAGTFLLGRVLGLSRLAALQASVVYAFNPFNLYYLEQLSGVSHCLFPLTFWAFARLAARADFGRAAAAGIASAVLILSGHPESSFFGITLATLLFLLLRLAGGRAGGTGGQTWRALFCAALFAGALSAPVLLPFIEYLRHSDCYKFAVGVSAYIPWQGLAYNMMQPGFGPASPYLGAVASALVPLGCLTAWQRRGPALAVAITGLAAFCLVSRMGPLHDLLLVPPLNYLITVYCQPLVLLAAAILSAFALDALIAGSGTPRAAVFFAFFSAVCILAVPASLLAYGADLSPGDFDLTLPHMAVSLPSLKRDALLLLLFATALFWGWRRPGHRRVVAVCVLTLSFAGVASAARGSLPPQPRFDYPLVEPVPYLQGADARFVALGDHLFRPNSASVYGLNDIRMHNPLFPARYRTFMEAAGARLDMFNQTFGPERSRLLDVAAVGYTLSLEPLEAPGSKLLLERTTAHGVRVYAAKAALPRAFIVHGWQLAASGAQALDLIRQPGFDGSAFVVLERQPSFPSAPLPADPAESVHLLQSDVNTVEIEVVAKRPGMLVLSDTFYPGWAASIDGKAVAIERANYLFRAIELLPGRHRVLFQYRPASFMIGSAAALAALLLLLVWSATRGLRPPACPGTAGGNNE